MKPFAAPIITAIALIALLLVWALTEKQLAEDKSQQEVVRNAEALFGAMKGSIQSNLRRGRGHKVRIGTILKNVTETTQLTYFEIRQGQEVISSSDKVSLPDIDSPQGSLRVNRNFWMWQTLELMDHIPHAYGNEQGYMGGRNGDADIDFNQQKQLVVLGLDVSSYDEELRDTLRHIVFMTGSGIIAAMVLAAAWSFILRNRELSIRLERESIRAEHLSDLQLAGAGLAHETKNPLGLIRGMAQQIGNCTDCPEPVQDLAFDMMEQADIATARLGEFIAFSKIRMPELQVIELCDATARICELMQCDAERLGVELVNEVPTLSVEADPGMLSQILTNLISNALNACSKGGRISVSTALMKERVELRVCDDGKGIASDFLPEVFKPYVTGREDGHGLGLAIVRRMVEDHGWRIELNSIEQQGTEVRIYDIPFISGGGGVEK